MKEIFVHLDRCTGCKSCELACAVEHSQSKKLFTAIFEKPPPRRRLWVEWVAPEYKVPVLCRHCEDAPCVHACIAGAIKHSEEGAVLTSDEKCIGCWTCVMVCPYGVIGRHVQRQKSYRCDRCQGRETPACVDACPANALVFTSAEAFSASVRKGVAKEIVAGKK